MEFLEKYLGQIHYIHGPGVAEESYYGALETLFNAVGDGLSPKVRCVMQIKDTGAGIPDGGFFTTDQLPHGEDIALDALPPLPARGAIEVKSPAEDVHQIARGEQVARYLKQYRQVLVANLRAFVLMGLDARGAPVELESYTLAESEEAFWAMAAHPRRAAHEHGERLRDYLARAMLLPAPLDDPADLAWFLASYAREARARIQVAMESGEFPAMDEVREVLEETLGIHFQGEKGDHFFRASLVQTLFYGIFSAWVLWHNQTPDLDARFDWRVATYHLRVPLIQALFERVATPSRLKQLDLMAVLNWTGALLNRVDRAAFFERFRQQQAVQYFYEPFLEAYDPELRKELGVWYTPPEVVAYMVARVDQVLQEELGLPNGLADPRVHVLDPCCGTGAYLVAVLERIADKLQHNGDALWAQDLKQAAMTRVFGFELLPAPFVVSHLQLGLLLQRRGVPLDESERAAVYLTNALAGWEPPEEEKRHVIPPTFRRERAAAERVKQDVPILVILGNPPYDSFADVAVGEERALSEAYRATKRGPKPRGQGLNDPYVRFYRMAERRIVEQTGKGIVCFISNYSWLDGLSHPGMRERYLDVFDKIWIDNLHGDRIISEYAPDGHVSETIFAIRGSSPGIKIGTDIALLVRADPHGDSAELLYRDLEQARADERRAALVDGLRVADFDALYKPLQPLPELGYPFKPKKAGEDYLDWPKLPDLFSTYYPGVKTSRDAALVEIDRDKLIARMEKYFDPGVSDEEIAQLAPALMHSSRRFKANVVRRHLTQRKEGFLKQNVVRYAYRPFDLRWLYWEPETKLLDEKRADYFPQVFEENIWFVAASKARREWSPPQFIKHIGSLHLEERGNSCFPLYIKEQGIFAGLELEPQPNLSAAARAYLAQFAQRQETSEVSEDLGGLGEQLFYHALAMLHGPAYREENGGALRQDWPRLPLPATAGALAVSAELGRRVAALLDPESDVAGVTGGALRPGLQQIAVIKHAQGKPLNPAGGDLAVSAGWGYTGRGDITMPGQGRLTELETAEGLAYDVWLNDVAYWHNVPQAVWAYTLGGYAVLKKWLSYRERRVLGRDLKPEEARAFTAIARRIAAILSLHPDLDASYLAIKQNTHTWNPAP